QVDVGVSKTDGVTTAVPGTKTTYTIVETNTVPSTATNIAVSDPLPAGVTSATWSGSNGSAGTGALVDTIASLAPGASVTYTLTVQINASATGLLVNTVTLTAANDTNRTLHSFPTRRSSDLQVDVGVSKTDGVTTAVPG